MRKGHKIKRITEGETYKWDLEKRQVKCCVLLHLTGDADRW